MTVLIFCAALFVGLLGLPMGMLGFLLLPPAIISLFNEFAAPREVLLTLLAIVLLSAIPNRVRMWQSFWLSVNPAEENPRDAALLGSGLFRDAASVIYLSQGWVGTAQSTWLIMAYWFICLAQLTNLLCLWIGQWIVYLGRKS